MSALADSFAAEFSIALDELSINSKPIITSLTMVAGDNKALAAHVVRVVEARIQKCPPTCVLPTMYLLDSICKNVGEPYIGLFSIQLEATVATAHRRCSSNTVRAKIAKLVCTWKPVFPSHVVQPIIARFGRPSDPRAKRPRDSHATVSSSSRTKSARSATDELTSLLAPAAPSAPSSGSDTATVLALLQDPSTLSNPAVVSALSSLLASPSGLSNEVVQLLTAALGNVVQSAQPSPAPPRPYGGGGGGGGRPVVPPGYRAPPPPSQHQPLPPPHPQNRYGPPHQAGYATGAPRRRPYASGSPASYRPPQRQQARPPAAAPLPYRSNGPILAHPTPPPGMHRPGNSMAPPPHPAMPRPGGAGARKFEREMLNAPNPTMVAMLYDVRMLQCANCALRLRKESELRLHMDWHFRRNQRKRNRGKEVKSRGWFLPTAQWAELEHGHAGSAAATQAPSDGTPTEGGGAGGEKDGAASAQSSGEQTVVADDEQTQCKECGEMFEAVWDPEGEDWMYKDAMKGSDGIIRHPSCWALEQTRSQAESSAGDAQPGHPPDAATAPSGD